MERSGIECAFRVCYKEKYMKEIKICDEFIKLGQAMKLAGLVDEGFEAKEVIQGGEVTVNGEADTRRGRKLYVGDTFCYLNETYKIIN